MGRFFAKYCFVSLLIAFLLLPNSQAQDPIARDLDRYEKLDIIQIESLANNIDSDARGAVRELDKMLNEFYLSDLSRKKIQQEQDVDDVYSQQYEYGVKKEWNVNSNRLYMKDLLGTPGKAYLIKEAPNLYLAHYTLARAYNKLKQPFKAAYHHKQALRYRSLKMSEEVFVNRDRIALLGKNSADGLFATQYIGIRKEYLEGIKNQKELQEKQYVLEDNMVRNNYASNQIIIEEAKDNGNNTDSVKDLKEKNAEMLRQQIENDRRLLADQIAKNKQSLAAQKQKNQELLDKFKNAKKLYENVEKKWNRDSSRFLVNTANLVKDIENSIKERQKVLNKKVLYKTSFNQTLLHDYSQNRQFTAYANLLEMGARLDPENPSIPYDLGEEYRTSQLRERAIYAYERSLEVNKNAGNLAKLDKKKISHVYMSLGGLYFARKNFVFSARNYEQALANAEDPARKRSLTFQVAKMHTEKTGNFKRAQELLLEYNKVELENKQPSDAEDRADWVKTRFKVFKLLSEVYQQQKRPTDTGKALLDAKQAHEDLEKLISDQRDLINKAYRDMQAAKKPLRDETLDRELNSYYRKQAIYKREKTFLGHLEAIRHSLPLRNVYFALARFYQGKHDINAAMNTYREAEIKGIAPDQARRHMQALRRRYGIR